MHTTQPHASGSLGATRAAVLPVFDIKRTSELAPEDCTRIKDWMHEAWPPEADPYAWKGLDWHVLARVDGELVSLTEVGARAITVGGQPMRVGALGNVYTPESQRGRGLATAAMLRAQELICGDLGVTFGLLLCEPDLISFYRRIGWMVAAGPLIFDQPPEQLAKIASLRPESITLSASNRQGAVTWPDVAMVYSCSGEPWPSGLIDLCGLPW